MFLQNVLYPAMYCLIGGVYPFVYVVADLQGSNEKKLVLQVLPVLLVSEEL